MTLIQLTDRGIYCEAGDFYVDPWRGVPRAVITHAHSDHARWGSESYLAAKEGDAILKMRLGNAPNYSFIAYGETVVYRGVRITLYPAAHMTGAAQVLIEHRGERCVISGDYKRQADPTTVDFEPVKCHTFVTESTFGLPIYRWEPAERVFAEINQWWHENQICGRCSVVFAYSVGKAQRILAGIDASLGPIVGHGAIMRGVDAYRACGVKLPQIVGVQDAGGGFDYSNALVLAPPSAQSSPWMQRFGNMSLASASGWMLVRGIRRRRGFERGFVLSDHVDWAGLMQTIRETEAEQIFVTHGYSRVVVEHLRQLGKNAHELQTEFVGDEELESVNDPLDDLTKNPQTASGLAPRTAQPGA